MHGGRYILNGVKTSTTACSILNMPDLPDKLPGINTDADHEMKPARMNVWCSVGLGVGGDTGCMWDCWTAGLLLVEATNYCTQTENIEHL